jgi:hypothetical protein
MTQQQQARRAHVAVVHADDGRRHDVLLRDGGDSFVVVHANLGGPQSTAVAAALKLMAERPGADLSISERTISEIEREPFCEDPDGLYGAASGVSLYILAPEGKPGEDPNDTPNRLWCDAWRSPWGSLSSSGRDGRFRERALLDVVAQRFAPDRQRQQTNHRSETLIRHDWRIRALAPRAFEPDQPTIRASENEAVQAQAAAGRLAESLS